MPELTPELTEAYRLLDRFSKFDAWHKHKAKRYLAMLDCPDQCMREIIATCRRRSMSGDNAARYAYTVIRNEAIQP